MQYLGYYDIVWASERKTRRKKTMKNENKKLGYMAVGNYGTKLQLTDANKHPRGQLLKKLGASHAAKMYIDTKDGGPKHVGYIIGGEWFNIYEVHAWEGK